MTKQETFETALRRFEDLKEVRFAISEVNSNAGETIFNPAATSVVNVLLREAEVEMVRAKLDRMVEKEAMQADLVRRGFIHRNPAGVPYPRPLTEALNWTRTALDQTRERLATLEAEAA